jgi:hypothetical protein
MVVAAIVQRFDLTFEESAWDDLKCTSDQFIIGTSGRNGVRARVTKAGKAS